MAPVPSFGMLLESMSPKTVFITGAKTGIGLELVRQFARTENGPAHIFASGRNAKETKSLIDLAQQHKNVHLIDLDVANNQEIEAAVKEVSDIVGDDGLNLLINNAALLEQKDCMFPKVDRNLMNRHFDVNATSVLVLVQAFLPLLKKVADKHLSDPMSVSKAAVINISSEAGSMKLKWPHDPSVLGIYAYAASKAALNMITKVLSYELKDLGILIAGFCPGYVDTKMARQILDHISNQNLAVPDTIQENQMCTPEQSVTELMQIFKRLTNKHHGGYFRRNGTKIDDYDEFESAETD